MEAALPSGTLPAEKAAKATEKLEEALITSLKYILDGASASKSSVERKETRCTITRTIFVAVIDATPQTALDIRLSVPKQILMMLTPQVIIPRKLLQGQRGEELTP